LRHSSPLSTGVLPVFATCFGPWTAETGFAGTTWPMLAVKIRHSASRPGRRGRRVIPYGKSNPLIGQGLAKRRELMDAWAGYCYPGPIN
jgi:hypothetical protein